MIVYSTGCPMCKKLLKRLEESNIDYTLCTDEAAMEKKGIDRVPMLETDEGELLDFGQAVQFIKAKENN